MSLKIFGSNNKNIKIQTILKEWLSTNQNAYKTSTYQAYKRIIEKHIEKSFLNELPIRKITQTHIKDFTDSLLKKGLSNKTVNDILLVLNILFKYANKYYDTPIISLVFVKEQKKEMRVLTISEQKALEYYLKEDVDIYKFASFFALYTGIRIGELCALKWKDISNNNIKINKTMHRLYDENGKSKIFIDDPKTINSNRTIPIPPILNYYIDLFRKNDEEFVLSTEKLKMIEPRLLQIKFKKIMEICALDDVTFHTLRHTFATRCVECGFDIKSLSEILGHADVKTTLNKYVHSSMDLKRANMEKLSQLVI